MCGNGKCIYYGCDDCLRYMNDPVVIATRAECDCTDDIYSEFCDDDCAGRYRQRIEDECACPAKPSFVVTTGPSVK